MRGPSVLVRSCLTCLLALMAAPLAAADKWVEAKSDHFKVIANAGDGAARKVAWQFEQIRAAIEQWAPFSSTKAPRPLVIVAAKNEATIKEFAPSHWAGPNPLRPGVIAADTEERTFIALRTDVQPDTRYGANPHALAYRSYTALALNETFEGKLPLWLNLGVSAVWSNLVIDDDELEFGRPLPQFVDLLRRGATAEIRGLLTTTSSSPWYLDPSTRSVVEAHSWALVHYLMFQAPKVNDASPLNAALALIVDGTPSTVAIERTFGNLDALAQAYVGFATKGKFTFTRVAASNGVSKEKYPVRALSEAEAGIVRAHFLVASEHAAEALAAVAGARKLGDTSIAGIEIEALALDRQDNRDAARAAYLRAVERGSSSFLVYYKLAELTSSPTADPATLKKMHDWLTRSVALNSTYFPALVALSTVLVQLDQLNDALPILERAAALEPGRADIQDFRARILAKQGRHQEALDAARGGLALAKTPDERQALQSVVDEMTRALKILAQAAPLAAVLAGPPPPGPAIKPLVRTKAVPPVYPAIAQSARVQGDVVVAALIGKDGRVIDVAVVQSIPLLDQAAIDAVRQWEFEPPTSVNGDAVTISSKFTIGFTLK